MLRTVLVGGSPVHGYGLSVAHAAADGELLAAAGSEAYLRAAANLIPSALSSVAQRSSDGECFGLERAAIGIEGNAGSRCGIVIAIPSRSSRVRERRVPGTADSRANLACGSLHIDVVAVGAAPYVGVAGRTGIAAAHVDDSLTVLVDTLEHWAVAVRDNLILTLAQGRHSLAYHVQLTHIGSQLAVQGLSNIARSGVGAEVGSRDRTLKVLAEVCTASLVERSVGSRIDGCASHEVYFRAVVNTGNATEGEHEEEVGCVGVVTRTIVGSRRIVVTVLVDNVERGIVVEVVALLGHAESLTNRVEVVVHREVYHVEARSIGVVRLVISTVLQESIV